MYETFMTVLRTFFGNGLYLLALKFAVPLVVLSLLAWSSPAFRAFCRSWRERGGWRAMSVTIPTALVKLLIVFLILRVVIVAMVFQAQQFEFKHGDLTAANRSAVEMKWGYPHEQNELAVKFTGKRTWVTRQLLIAGDKDHKNTITSDSFWKDDDLPVQEVDGVLPKVISLREEQKDVDVVQKAIQSADVHVALTSDERSLGGANYAGYRDSWDLKYVIVNRSDKPVVAHLNFPLPCKTGNFNKVNVTVDDKSMADHLSTNEEGIRWSMPMLPAQKCAVRITYDGRGLDYLRYVPKRMTQTGHYLVTATINGIPAREMDWCIGSMPPDQKLDQLGGKSYNLTWTLDDALTSYDIGIKLPEAKQPNYYVASLLNEAPVGLILLLLLLVVPRFIVGQPVALTSIGLISAAYYLLYTFLGRLADIVPSFALSFFLSATILCALVAFLRLRDKSSPFLAQQDVVGFIALAVLYPLAIVDSDRTAFWMHIFYIAILVYVCALTVRFRILRSPENKGAPSGE